jgi:hypothetical protein
MESAGCRSQLPAIIAGELATAAAAWAATGTVLTGLGLVDGQGTAAVLFAVQSGNGRIALGRTSHGDEAEAAGLTGHFVGDESHLFDLAMLFEQILQIVLSGLEGKISYVQFHLI